MTKGLQVATIALAEVGTKESPANSNMQKYGEWFGYNGVFWCAEFVSWSYYHAGYPLGHLQYKNGIAGCPWAVNHFKETKEIISKEQAKPGDIVFFDWNGDGRYDHVGIFNGWADKSKWLMYTIEGNTSKTNNSNGGEVMNRNDRKASSHTIFVHPKVLD